MLLSVNSHVIDTATREVRRAGRPIAVEPKVFDLLLFLIAHRDRVLAKDEIVERIWARRAVSDAALSSCVKAARRALGDDGRAQSVIRTVHRRGFRFIGAVAEDAPPVAAPGSGVAPGDDPGGAPPPGMALHQDLTPPREPSIVVLPIEILSATEGAGTVADGIVQDIITGLGRTRRFFVIGRGTAFALRGRAGDPRDVARSLGVRYILSGSLRYDGRRIRLSASLADAVEPFEVWADSFDRAVDDILALQDEVSELIVSRVQTRIEDSERREAMRRPIARLDAWSAYYRARWHLDRHTARDYDEAEGLLGVAARLDPTAARIFAGLSFVHRQRAFLNLTTDRGAEVERAVDLARHSLSLDPQDPQSHWAFGRALMLRCEVEAARQAFETSTSLNPSFAIGQYSVGFAHAMAGTTGTSDEALAKALRLSPIDPMRFAMLATHAFNCVRSGEPERAADLARLAAAQPNAHYHIFAIAALCGALAGQRQDAGRHLRRLRGIRTDYTSADFFDAFPFQSEAHIAMFREGFKLIGIPP
ncbi:MAG: winged helix-turn-helix domain-containing protein [Rhodospirillales bacterium]|nr:MAG: winged helix-turn-helix domain-containing protein [Rhodospirillales bacterium]